MEREADEGGQILCAAAGYDPMGMSTFLTSLALASRLELGYTRNPSFFDTHPGSEERAAVNAVRAREIRWRRDPALGDPRAALLRRIDGLEVAQRPEAGMFEGDRFVHPVLGFTVRFPSGWQQAEHQPRRRRRAAARRGGRVPLRGFAAGRGRAGRARLGREAAGDVRLQVEDSRPVKVGGIDAWRVEASAVERGNSLRAQLTFIPFRDATWRITGAAPSVVAKRHEGSMLSTARSFRPLTDEERAHQRGLACASPPPAPARTSPHSRSGRATSGASTTRPSTTRVFADHRFEGGESVKIAVRERYVGAAR